MLRRFFKATAGVAAIEFALIAPVLITLYFGMAELTQALMAQRRISHATATLGDLVAQGQTTSTTELTDVFKVGTAIMSPFPTGPLKMRVTSITANASNVAKVDWSIGQGMTGLSKGSTQTVPSGVIAANQSVIKSEVTYVYSSSINYFLPSPLTFSNTYYLRPRLSDQVVCATC